MNKFEPKPDKSRLLTSEEQKKYTDFPPDFDGLIKAQDVKTYPIAFEEGHKVGIAKCQARVERIFKEIDKHRKENALHGIPIISEDFLQALKKREGIK